MTSFGFAIGILFILKFVTCEGSIFLPPDGDILVVAPGADVTIEWTFNNSISQMIYRSWSFTSGSSSPELIAIILSNGEPVIINSSLPGVEIRKPSTLVLTNIDYRYNGTYKFSISGGIDMHRSSTVSLFVAVLPSLLLSPNVTVCSSPIEVDEGDDVRCLCTGEGGIHPANLTWFKNGVQIVTRKEENMLSLTDVDKTVNGIYKCVAQSYVSKDEKSIEVIVNFAPEVTSLTSSPSRAILGKSVTISCIAIGHPEPTYFLIHNTTKTASTDKTYTIDVVRYTHAGSYQCAARNRLGNSSKTFNLIVTSTGPILTTTGSVPTKSFDNVTATESVSTSKFFGACNRLESSSLAVWHLVVSYVIWYCH